MSASHTIHKLYTMTPWKTWSPATFWQASAEHPCLSSFISAISLRFGCRNTVCCFNGEVCLPAICCCIVWSLHCKWAALKFPWCTDVLPWKLLAVLCLLPWTWISCMVSLWKLFLAWQWLGLWSLSGLKAAVGRQRVVLGSREYGSPCTDVLCFCCRCCWLVYRGDGLGDWADTL